MTTMKLCIGSYALLAIALSINGAPMSSYGPFGRKVLPQRHVSYRKVRLPTAEPVHHNRKSGPGHPSVQPLQSMMKMHQAPKMKQSPARRMLPMGPTHVMRKHTSRVYRKSLNPNGARAADSHVIPLGGNPQYRMAPNPISPSGFTNRMGATPQMQPGWAQMAAPSPYGVGQRVEPADRAGLSEIQEIAAMFAKPDNKSPPSDAEPDPAPEPEPEPDQPVMMFEALVVQKDISEEDILRFFDSMATDDSAGKDAPEPDEAEEEPAEEPPAADEEEAPPEEDDEEEEAPDPDEGIAEAALRKLAEEVIELLKDQPANDEGRSILDDVGGYFGY